MGLGGSRVGNVHVTSMSASLESTMRRIMLIMQTLPRHSVGGQLHQARRHSNLKWDNQVTSTPTDIFFARLGL